MIHITIKKEKHKEIQKKRLLIYEQPFIE